MKKLLLSLCLVLPTVSYAQYGYDQDAFRYSRLTSVSGSSRIQSIGGAQTAIGGDISNIAGNPAGLGFFGKSTFSIGIGAGGANTQTAYFTQKENANATTGGGKGLSNLNHLACVFTMKPKEEKEGSSWKGGSFGFSVSRANNFQNQIAYKGINSQNSRTDSYANSVWGTPEHELQSPVIRDPNLSLMQTMYLSEVIATYNGSMGQYISPFRPSPNGQLAGKITQEGNMDTKGGQYQWNFGFGGNVADKFYFGVSAGMTTLNYRQYLTYKETISSTAPLLNTFTDFDSLQVKGTGINVSVGFVVRPVNAVRIGASFTAPTSFSIQETYGRTFAYMRTNATKGDRISAQQASYSYNLRTPMRANLGLAVFIKKNGFVTIEAEYVAYKNMNLRDYDDATLFTGDNSVISQRYKNTFNFKGGAEIRFEKFYVRAGGAYQPNPLNKVDNIDRSLLQITGGVGINFENNTVDFGLVNTSYKSAYEPYSANLDTNGYGNYLSVRGAEVGNSPYSTTKHNLIQGVLTYSRKF